MVGVAAGLANGGFIPFVCAAAPFLTGRALEQIKVDVAYNGYPVVLCGMSPGMAYGELGPTHHSIEDSELASRDRRAGDRRPRRSGADRAPPFAGRRRPACRRTCASAAPRRRRSAPTRSRAFEFGRADVLREGDESDDRR